MSDTDDSDEPGTSPAAGGPQESPRVQALRDLGEEIFEEINRRLVGKVSVEKVAAWLQDELQVLTDQKRPTLIRKLYRYRNRDLHRFAMQEIEKAGKHAFDFVKTKLNPLVELEELASLQRRRLAKLMKREDEMPHGASLDAAHVVARDYHRVLDSMAKIQLETGLIQKAPKKITGTVTDPQGGVRQFSWSEEREQILAEIGIELPPVHDEG